MNRMARMVALIAIGTQLISGCREPSKKLVGPYRLESFNEGATVYYLIGPGFEKSPGGVFEGTVEEIGWNQDWILARVKRLYGGDTNGLYALNLKKKEIIGPLRESEVSSIPSLSTIKPQRSAEVFSGKK